MANNNLKDTNPKAGIGTKKGPRCTVCGKEKTRLPSNYMSLRRLYQRQLSITYLTLTILMSNEFFRCEKGELSLI